jgi:serine/threonine protein kinase
MSGLDLIGHRIGNFALTRVLGRGGMGIVYLAEHTFLERRKAVKVLLPDAAESPVLVRRFFDEAMAASACQHDHIVSVEDCGTFSFGGKDHHYIEMEYLEGQHVGDALKEAGGHLEDVDRATRIAAQAAGALAAAHARGVVHRDVKPENLFLTRRGQRKDFLKVLDFGIARLTGDLSPGQRTRTGAVIGTPEYMSPEQARGLHPDGKSDVFSLGVVLYRMIAGVLPFSADNFSLLAMKIAGDEPASLAEVRPGAPRAVVHAVEAAMRKAAGDRPTMDELRQLLLDVDAAPRPIGRETAISVSAPIPPSGARTAPPRTPELVDRAEDITPPLRPSARKRND